jgi:DNA repair exonuclease SbcCD ATPase subunit
VIGRVLLRNWRGYEKLALDLGPGLTFVVADNGVGKTSLVHGASWALFGEASGVDGDAAIRAGAAEATAEVDLVLSGTRFTVSRSLRRTGRGRERLTVTAEPAGDAPDNQLGGLGDAGSATSGRLREALAAAWGVPAGILPQLVFVPEMRLTHEGELFADVQDHLAALLGIDDLRRAEATADAIAGATTRRIRAARAVARVDEQAVAATRAEAERLRAELAELDSAIGEDVAARADLDGLRRRFDAWARYDEQLARHRRRLDDLSEQARAVGLEADPDAVAEAARDLTRRSDELRDALATARAEAALVEGLVEQLDAAGAADATGAAGAVCPVCLRPVDDETAHRAAAQHHARLADIAAREAAAEQRRAEVEAAARRIMVVAGALARQRPPEPPATPRPDVDEPELLTRMGELDARLAERYDRKGMLGERLRRAEDRLAEADTSREASAELTRLHAAAAAATSLATLARAEAEARTERSLDPLSRALAERWGEFFGTRSSRPRLAGGGTIELGPAGATIPYAAFSGGEKTLASLLTRLLFVTSATRLRTMWLDEPLEHLDPANRSRLARLVAQATQPGNHMHQVVVTTYEEGLARTMADHHDATVLYVSTDDLL